MTISLATHSHRVYSNDVDWTTLLIGFFCGMLFGYGIGQGHGYKRGKQEGKESDKT